MVRVLFVCTGNTCRSPMAAQVLRRGLAEAGLAADVASAGLRTQRCRACWTPFGPVPTQRRAVAAEVR